MYLRMKDLIINLSRIQYIRRIRNKVLIYFEGERFEEEFDTEAEATDYLCGMSSMLVAKEPRYNDRSKKK